MRKFAFTLALALGCTVRELLARIDAAELVEWMAYYELDPFGGERGDLQAGIIAAAAIAPHARKGHKVKPSDYMPKFGQRHRPKQNIMQRLRQITAAMGGSIVEKL